MNKTAAVREIIAAASTLPVVFTAGHAAEIARAMADAPNHFHLTGSMGLASSVGIGVALETDRVTVVVDGERSLLMNPVGLIIAGALGDLPLVHIVLDDGLYASTGGEVLPASRSDLCGLATAAGYRHVYSTAKLHEFSGLVRSQIAQCTGPVFIRCALVGGDSAALERTNEDLPERARRFYDYICVPEWLAPAA